MSGRNLIAFLSVCCLLAAGAGEARARGGVAAGTVHSPKGSGLALRLDHGERMYDLSMTADLYGVIRHPDQRPGYCLSLYYNPVLYRAPLPSGGGLRLYAGPGFSTAWVADRNVPGFGFAAMLNGDLGASFDFTRQLSVTLGINAGFGLHVVRADHGGALVRLYRNGLLRALYPEARLLYRFGEDRTLYNKEDINYQSITFGIENNVYALLYARADVDFLVEEGYRVHDITRTRPYRAAGEILAFAGYRFSRWFDLALYAGYAGEYRDARMFPLSLRATLHDGRRKTGGALVYLDGGAAWSEYADEKAGVIGKVGAGYSWALGGRASLRLAASVRFAMLHPHLFDPVSGVRIDNEAIFSNNVYVVSAGLGVALCL